MNATAERVRAVLRLLGNDEITPMGRRMIEKVLAAEDPILTWFDCSRCGQTFHIHAGHKDDVEAHHRKLAHAGDVAAVLMDRDEED